MRVLSHGVSRKKSRRRAGAAHPLPLDSGSRERDGSTAATAAADLAPDGAPHGEADVQDVVITRQRAGLYVLSDADGAVIGRIFGDYVVGFTAQYQGESQRFEHLDDAKGTIAGLHAAERSAPSPA